jgi:hypothetical protein
MNSQRSDSRRPHFRGARSLIGLALVGVALAAMAGCGGTAASATAAATAASPTSAGTVAAPTTEPAPGASGAEACIDPETAAIIAALRESDADVETIITEQGDTLVAGLQAFTPPADAATWRDELVAAVEDGDVQAVETKVQAIGSAVTLSFC